VIILGKHKQQTSPINFGFSCEGDSDSHSERERSDIHEDEQDLQVLDTEEEECPRTFAKPRGRGRGGAGERNVPNRVKKFHCKFLGVSTCDLLEFHNITDSVGNSGPDSD
jgi:hypothetical protein